METKIQNLICEIPAEDFIRRFVDIPRFFACCEKCPGFGKTWACPPYDFDPLSVWQRFSSVMLYGKKLMIGESLRQTRLDDEALSRTSYFLFDNARRALLEELFTLERENTGSLALSAGGCSFCENCTRPQGLPCRSPERMRFSVESLGGDVSKALNECFGIELKWAENGRLPEYYVLLGALLKKQLNHYLPN